MEEDFPHVQLTELLDNLKLDTGNNDDDEDEDDMDQDGNPKGVRFDLSAAAGNKDEEKKE